MKRLGCSAAVPIPAVAGVDWPAAVQSFIDFQTTRFHGGEITIHGWQSTCHECGDFRDFLKRSGHGIDAAGLMAYRSWLVARYTAGHVGLATLQRKLYAAKRVCTYLWEMGVLVEIPRNARTACTFNLPKAQRVAAPVIVYTLEECKKLLAACEDERTKLFFLLHLNCGMYYSDIADLRHNQYADGVITRGRHKTGETGRWKLWQTTRELLEKFATPPDDPNSTMLRSETGEQLYGYEAGQLGKRVRRVNRIESKMKMIIEKAGVGGSPLRLRKTGSTLVKNVSDRDTGKLFLANSKESIAELHYLAEDYCGLDAALDEVGEMLGV